jgi:hypothetical protein
MLDIYGSNNENPGDNACKLARIIAASVLGNLKLLKLLFIYLNQTFCVFSW